MWHGRFSQDPSQRLRAYGESVSFDNRLALHDISGSKAHAAALRKAGFLTADELKAIHRGLDAIAAEVRSGKFKWREELEDVHMNIEAALTKKIGAPGAKLHTARSRNDQVATDLRLWMRDETKMLVASVRDLQKALIGLAVRAGDTIMPGYTHLQRAQPVPASHHLLAYIEMLERDAGRLEDTVRRAAVLPLGSGALAGSTLVLDRRFIARQLGFAGVSQNSMDAVSDRDFACEFLSACAICGMHLSRLCEDTVLWASSEFGFLRLSDAHTTGSSLMPQKKNPDIAELARGKTGRLYGNLFSLLTTLKGLPLSYNRDLQEDKEPVFDSADTLGSSLQILAEMFAAAQWDKERMAAAAEDALLVATDWADYLVRKGLPFRQAHEVVGRLVALSIKRGATLRDLSLGDLQRESALFAADALRWLDARRSLSSRTAEGAPSPRRVAARLAWWRKHLSAQSK
ncbi:MAG: argininosuccinate lyase [Chthoniobacterales bacterium]|nr:argininosuccinate lyase [Chthoniobacterales bacterium]